MRKRFMSFSCWIAAVIITGGLSLLTAYFGWFYLFVVVTAVLGALDARRIRVWRYQSDIALKPGTLFILLLLLWPIVFPSYFGLRLRIWGGAAEFKKGYQFPGN